MKITKNITKYSQFDPNLVLWLRMQEGPNAVAFDYSGSSNHGIIYGATWSSPGLTFNGISDYIDGGNGVGLNFTNTSNFTVDAWVKKIADPGSGDTVGLVSKGIPGSTLYGMDYYFGGNQIRVGIRNPTDGPIIARYNPPSNLLNWTYIVFTYTTENAIGIKLYVDAVLRDSVSTIGLHDFSAANVLIGGNNVLAGSSKYFNGTIDNVRVFNIDLSLDQINSTFQSTRNKYGV